MWSYGGGWGWLCANIELYVLDSEQCRDCVSAVLTVLFRSQQEEECDPGEVSDGFLAIGAAVCGSIQRVDNGDMQWSDSCGKRIFYIVGHEFSAQAKVEGAYSIESEVWGPHDREELAYRADV